MTGQGTQAVWAGEEEVWPWGSTQVPIVPSVGFSYHELDDWVAVATGVAPGHIYTRNSNPTVAVLAEKVRILEGGEAASCFASGMAAISGTLHALLRPGNRLVSVKDTYGGTNRLFTEFLPAYGISVDLVHAGDGDELVTLVEQGCHILYLETPSNPTLRITDLRRMIQVAHDAGALVVVDNTVATPINQRPLTLGADLVVHSATKFLGGHADALGGVVVGRLDLVDRADAYREINGASLEPMSAYLLLRGLKTLHLRIARQSATAQSLAEHLAGHPKVRLVNYPGLSSHPGHDVARSQMDGYGGLLSFELDDDATGPARFLRELDHAHAAANLGAVETTVGPPATTSHVEVSATDRKALGVPDGLIRYSAGIEDLDDLVDSLDRALKAV